MRRARLRRAARRVQGRFERSAARRDRADDQGPGRLVHGAPARAPRGRRHVPVARGRAGRRELRARARRAARPGSVRWSSSPCRLSRTRCPPRRSRRSRRAGPGRERRCRASTSPRRTGEALLELAAEHEDLVVLDADLASDCRVRAFELAYPDRFVECGIAEQDMVSTAAGLARHGLLPVVNSFASFLASRANEQIYNQASEGSKVIYALPLRGPDPGRARDVAPEPAGHLAARGPAGDDDRPAGERGGDAGRAPLGRRGGEGKRRDPARDRALAAADRAARRATARSRAAARCSARARTRSSSRTGR